MAYEALNNASQIKKNFIIVLNDNNMSISENVGGMSAYLANFRTADSYRDLKANVMKSLPTGSNGIPSGWTVLNYEGNGNVENLEEGEESEW
jgi:deoxyxylulose-5-phosphate synthase